MSRRVRLPGADELFRSTSDEETSPGEAGDDEPTPEQAEADPAEAPDSPRRGSGRIKHDEKMTVYLTAEELLAVEQARLALRREIGQAVDRGRLVREAIALALADFEARGADSDLARRLLHR